MNHRYLEDDDIDEIPRDREISLGATTLLGIFFLLALVCAVFFGFGYSVGRKSSNTAIASTGGGDSVEASTIKTTGGAKPSPAESPAVSDPDTTSEDSAAADTAPATRPAPVVPEAPQKHPAKPTPAPAVVASAPAPKPVLMPAAVDTTHSTGPAVPSLVQVAAVSHQEDADVLLSALKRRGYSVSVRHEPQDKLLHIQIGPLATRKDADAMRQRLLSDGYNAIVK